MSIFIRPNQARIRHEQSTHQAVELTVSNPETCGTTRLKVLLSATINKVVYHTRIPSLMQYGPGLRRLPLTSASKIFLLSTNYGTFPQISDTGLLLQLHV